MVGVLFDHKKTKQKQIIKITPLSGGLESKDFCLIILRLIEKFLAQNKIKNEVIEKTEHIIQLEVLAEKNFLKSFHGIFKLVRVSPFGKNGILPFLPNGDTLTNLNIPWKDFKKFFSAKTSN